MLAPPLPPNEAERLRALLALELLDTAPEERFDRITRIAARLFDMPIVLVSLIDTERQWFKSRVGTDVTETPRDISFCAHTILQDDVLAVRNLAADERFSDNPIVTGMHARFYAGMPVRAPDGTKAGTLCLLDTRSRRLDDEQYALLRDLAAQVSDELAATALLHTLRLQRDTELWMRALLDRIPEGIVLLDGAGTVQSANPAAERIFGTAADALVGCTATDLLADDPAALRRQLSTGTVVQLQATGRRADGTPFAAEFSVGALRLAGERRYAAIVRDVSPRRENERRDRAADTRRRKYFTTATHELRTPMASVLGFSELLLKRDFTADGAREIIGIIHGQAVRLVALINEMLDLARIESGGVAALDIQPLQAAALLEQTLAGLDGLASGHQIRVERAADLPPVLADAAKLQQALLNVIGNALKYSEPASAIDIALAAGTLRDAPAVAFRVADHGIGMTPEQQGRVFDPFYRTGTKTDAPGSGLGLTIVREIVELHKGSVQLDSVPGEGTTVTLLLPAAVP